MHHHLAGRPAATFRRGAEWTQLLTIQAAIATASTVLTAAQFRKAMIGPSPFEVEPTVTVTVTAMQGMAAKTATRPLPAQLMDRPPFLLDMILSLRYTPKKLAAAPVHSSGGEFRVGGLGSGNGVRDVDNELDGIDDDSAFKGRWIETSRFDRNKHT